MQITAVTPFTANKFAFAKPKRGRQKLNTITTLRSIHDDLNKHAVTLIRFLSDRVKSHNAFWEEPFPEYMWEPGTEAIDFRSSFMPVFTLTVRQLEFVLHAPEGRWLTANQISILRSNEPEYYNLVQAREAFCRIRRELRALLDRRALDHHYSELAVDTDYEDHVGTYFSGFREEFWPQLRSAFRMLRKAIAGFQKME